MPRSFLDILTQSVIPRSVTDPYLNKVAQPGLRTPKSDAMLGGFAAGATQGALDTFTSPLAIAGEAGILGRLANAAKGSAAIKSLGRIIPTRPVVPHIDQAINALEREIAAAERTVGDMASGPFWVSGSVSKQIEPLREELKMLKAVKASREAPEFVSPPSAPTAAEPVVSAPTNLQVIDAAGRPISQKYPTGQGVADEADLLIQEMRKRIGLADQEIPKVVESAGQRTSQKLNIYK